ncbi:hypothetical protein MAUB1S_04640 [Mycolicibacterium aubagnense]
MYRSKKPIGESSVRARRTIADANFRSDSRLAQVFSRDTWFLTAMPPGR